MSKQRAAALACAMALASSGCAVEQEQPGTAPDVAVEVDPGRWPQYDVNWADVNVGTSERTITVPVVSIEQERREVSVPYIDINPPGAAERDERTISMEVDVPTAGYELTITEIRAAEDNLWVIAQLREPAPGTVTAQVVTRVSDQVVVNAPEDLDVRTVVIGSRPQGVTNPRHRFVESMSALEQEIPAGARVIYQRAQGQPQAPGPRSRS